MNWLEETLIQYSVSRYQLSKATQIPESTLSRIISNNVPKDIVRHGIISKIDSFFETQHYLNENKEAFNMGWTITRNGQELYENGELIDEETSRFFIVESDQKDGWHLGRVSWDSTCEEFDLNNTIIQLWSRFSLSEQSMFIPLVEQFIKTFESDEEDSETLDFMQNMVSAFDVELKDTQISLLRDRLFIYYGPIYDTLLTDSDDLIAFNKLVENNQFPSAVEQLLMIFILMNHFNLQALTEEFPQLAADNKAEHFRRLFNAMTNQTPTN